MAKKYTEFKAESQKHITEIDHTEEQLAKFSNNRQQQWGAMAAGLDSIKDRIKVLKDKGVKAATVQEYAKGDPETLKLFGGVTEFFKLILATADKSNVEHKKYIAAKTALTTLAAEVKKEVDEREKKKGGLLSIDSKSLPDLKKLSAELEKKVKDTNKNAMIYKFMDEVDFKKRLAGQIADTL